MLRERRGVSVWLLWLAVLGGGCVDSASVACEDGRLCPSNTACDDVNHGCVLPAQLEVCVGSVDGVACDIAGQAIGICRHEVCLRQGCGDHLAAGSEQCDREDLRGIETCDQLGYHNTAPVTCRDDCTFDKTLCAGYCGDGVAQVPPEDCDGGDLAGATCTSLGFHGGTLSCLDNCSFNLIGCVGTCGDGAVNGAEVCDGTDFGGAACTTRGYYTGSLTCSTDCATIGESNCIGRCGDHVRNGPEVCDDADFGGASCGTFDFYDGALACASCAIDTTGCAGYCGDGAINGGELCDGVTQPGACDSFGAKGGPLGCNGFCQTDFDRCHWGQWRTTPSGTTNQIYDLWASGPTDVWTVGADLTGMAGHFDGRRWRQVNIGIAARGVWGAAAADVWAVGSGGEIRRYDGTTWSAFGAGVTTTDLVDVSGSAANDVWIVGEAGLILHWNGTAFTKTTMGTRRWLSVWAHSPTDVWAVGEGPTTGSAIAHFDGTSWSTTLEPTRYLVAVRGTSTGDVWIVGYTGTILHYDPGTTSWVQLGPDTGASLWAVWPTSPTDVWVAGTGGTIRHWDGTAWTDEPSGTSAELYGLWRSSGADLWAAGAGGVITHYDGPGWTGSSVGGESLTDVASTSRIAAWASAAMFGQGGMFRYDGTDWTLDLVTVDALYGVWATASDAWAVGSNGTIVHHDAGGWSPSSSGTTATLSDVWGIGGQVWGRRDDRSLQRHHLGAGQLRHQQRPDGDLGEQRDRHLGGRR
ncbi:MAG: hypothetical protein NT062_07070 [Proteobacteria bacterium]|nr:hypothetical protein [Pseudomonadota bacterium]